MVQGSGFRFQGSGPRVQGCVGYRVQDAGCRVQGAGCRVQGAGCKVRVQGAGFRVQGAGCRSLHFGSRSRVTEVCPGKPHKIHCLPKWRVWGVRVHASRRSVRGLKVQGLGFTSILPSLSANKKRACRHAPGPRPPLVSSHQN
jgi:hypothetical protein